MSRRARYPLAVIERDTEPEAREAQLAALRRLGGAGRLEQALRLTEQARQLSIAGMTSRTPGLSDEEARRLLLRRTLGAELYEAAYRTRE